MFRPQFIPRYLCLISLPFLINNLRAADQWVRFSTPHFELYTSAGEKIPDPDRVQIKHSAEVKHEFACSQQKPYKVIVDYAVLPDPTTGSAGVVRGLEF